MPNDYNPQSTNSAKRLPIVFCLDVSPSMNGKASGSHYSRIDLLNIALKEFVAQLRSDPKACASAEIALVTFSTNIERNDLEFQPIKTFAIPTLSTVTSGGTNMANAILTSVEKLERRKRACFEKDIPLYLPFLVIVTDGNPDNNDDKALFEQAVREVQQHCDSHGNADNIIVPYVIGVGDDVNHAPLDRLAERFSKGCILIDDGAIRENSQIFRDVFKFIGNSVKNSVHLNGNAEDIFNLIRNEEQTLFDELESARIKRGGKPRLL